MRTLSRWCRATAAALALALVMSGCFLIPGGVELEQLVGKWTYSDGRGFSSTMRIEPNGQVSIDSAPSEVFLPSNWLKLQDWDGEVDSTLAMPAEGQIVIYEGTPRIGLDSPTEFAGGQTLYLADDGTSISFGVGNPDYQNWVRYLKE